VAEVNLDMRAILGLTVAVLAVALLALWAWHRGRG
jgi:hypothetical protein